MKQKNKIEDENLELEDENLELEDDVIEDIDDDDIEEVQEKADPKKTKKKMSKKIKAIIAAVVIVVLLAGIGGVAWYILGRKGNSQEVDYTNLIVDMDGVRYLGTKAYVGNETTPSNTFNIVKMLGLADGSTVTSNTISIATISGDNITILGTGTLSVTITENGTPTTKDLIVVEGVNAINHKEMWNTAVQKSPVVLQADVAVPENCSTATGYVASTDSTGANTNTIFIYNKVYGNGYTYDATNTVLSSTAVKDKYYVASITVNANTTIQDLHVTGKMFTTGETVVLDKTLGQHGILFNIAGSTSEQREVTVKHCVIENAQRGVYAAYADLTIEGTILRNFSDTGLSLESKEGGTSNITLRNDVFGSATVAGILFWGFSAGVTEENYVTLNVEGFLDIYNWKNGSAAQICPESEFYASFANEQVQKNMSNAAFEKYLYTDSQGNKNIHCGMFIICSGSQNDNVPTINGLENVGLTRQTFELPSAISSILKHCEIVGYVGKNPTITPDEAMSQNVNLYKELREGR